MTQPHAYQSVSAAFHVQAGRSRCSHRKTRNPTWSREQYGIFRKQLKHKFKHSVYMVFIYYLKVRY